MAWPLDIGGADTPAFGEQEALQMLAGFAFWETPVIWNAPEGVLGELGAPPDATMRPLYGYRSFDCVETSPYGLSAQDLLMTAAVDSRVKSGTILSVLAIAEEIAAVINQIPVSQTFWDLDPADLTGSPEAGTPAWYVRRALVLLSGLDEVGVTLTHKTLHHKRPWLFPTLDEATSTLLGGDAAWTNIHRQLNLHRREFAALESSFALLASSHAGVAITRLRIHDILVWGDLSGNRSWLANCGATVLYNAGWSQPSDDGGWIAP